MINSYVDVLIVLMAVLVSPNALLVFVLGIFRRSALKFNYFLLYSHKHTHRRRPIADLVFTDQKFENSEVFLTEFTSFFCVT